MHRDKASEILKVMGKDSEMVVVAILRGILVTVLVTDVEGEVNLEFNCEII